jgi:ABC-type transport system involved in multi-copper enzyme maturation permease subunit
LAAWAGAGLAAAVWVLRRQQQKEAGDQVAWTRKAGSTLRHISRPKAMPSAAPQDAAVPPSLESIHVLSQGTISIRPASGWRIVQTIAANDIRQSIHNKLILSILLGTTLLMAGNAMLLRGLSALSGSPANLAVSSSPVLAIMISMVLLTLGVTLVPLLMVEEKEAHTLEALLVSPARYRQVVAGKALAGAVYCLSAAAIILVAYGSFFVHWEVALLALLLGTAFVVGLGLLLGMLSNNPTTIGMWAAVALIILIIPMVLTGLGSLAQVSWAAALVAYWPSTAIVKLFSMAMVAEIPRGAVMGNVSVLIGAAVILYGLTWWVVRRSDQ